jgi:hypothetical protein
MNATPIEFKVTSKVPVDRLRLDRLNPRLIGQANNASDESIIARLYRSAEIDELLQSMSANGYLDIEPLIVMQDPNSDCLIVLEGNRRLAALRLLREADPINRMWTSKEIRIRVPPVDDLLRSTFHHVSVYAVDSRQRARSFIGFKHINGPAKWDAYAKAKFAADWYRSERPHVSLEAIAGSIGDRHDTIKRMVSAIYVLEQAEREELFDTHDRNTRKFNFSHLYTALSRSQYMDYLGLGRTWARYDPAPDPVPVERLDELRKMLVWIYGSKSTDELSVVRSQNPDIKNLGEVLVHTEARNLLETTHNLDQAHETTEAIDKKLTGSLFRARDAVRDASASLRAYDGRDKSLLDVAEDIKVQSDSVHARMERTYRRANVTRTKPNVRRPGQPVIEHDYTAWSLGEHLEGMLRCTVHNFEHGFDERRRHRVVKQV